MPDTFGARFPIGQCKGRIPKKEVGKIWLDMVRYGKKGP